MASTAAANYAASRFSGLFSACGGDILVSPISIWANVAGAAVLVIGVAAARRELSEARGLNKLVALGAAFVAAPLAAFGMEHQFAAPFMVGGVPKWIPWHLFWVYFVGVALIAAGLSIATNVLRRWSALLAGCMIAIFVVTIHLPNVMAKPENRFFWIVMFRDLAFASGLWALAASCVPEWKGSRAVITAVRFYLGALMVFYAVEHFLFPVFAPGVPLENKIPAWVPAPTLWGYLIGALLLAGGAAMLLNLRAFSARSAAIWIGAVMTAIVVCLYLPILLMASGTALIVEGLNYVADTLLMGGVLLVTAKAMRETAAS
jgi:uncharacterized membrane protein